MDKKVAVFDIDGSIFRSSLLIELLESLVSFGIFPENTQDIYKQKYKEWFDRKGTYEDYIDAVVKAFSQNIVGVNLEEFNKIVSLVVEENKYRVYRYTRDLIFQLKQEGYFLLAISHSPKIIVQDFCKNWGFDKVYGRDYEIENGVFTGKVLYLDLINDKSKILSRVVEQEALSLQASIACGDSEGDISLLKMVDRPICFNPNLALYQEAKKNNWKIVVERKNVIYEL